MIHRYTYELLQDGDYVVFGALVPLTNTNGWRWVEFTRWLIPNSQIED